MVSVLSPEDILEQCTAPYKKALDLHHPIKYRFNHNRTICNWTQHNDTGTTHILHIDPVFTHAPFSNTRIPSLEAVIEDEAKLGALVGCLCEFHLSEAVNPILLLPPVKGRSSSLRKDFGAVHSYTVKMWRDDVFLSRWPSLFRAQHTANSRYYWRCMEEAFRGGKPPETIYSILLGIAQLKAIASRSHDTCLPDVDAYRMLKKETPLLALNIRDTIEVWEAMPSLTYNPSIDLEVYKEAVESALHASSFRGTARLMRRGESYTWQVCRKQKK